MSSFLVSLFLGGLILVGLDDEEKHNAKNNGEKDQSDSYNDGNKQGLVYFPKQTQFVEDTGFWNAGRLQISHFISHLINKYNISFQDIFY